MNKKTLTLIGLTTLLATAATFLLAAGPKGKEEGKFHLVYLVAAVDLKPGSKVTVDPVFFTDGKTVKNFHLFCRQGMHPLKLSQVAADRQFIENYCSRKSFTIDPRGFHMLNNHGQQLTLGSIEFKVIGEFTHTGAAGHPIIPPKDSVMMGHTQARSYTPGTVEPPRWLRNDGAPEYFFLMSRDRQILEKIVPVSRATPAEVEALTKRAVEFSKIAKWRMAGTPVHLKDVENARPGLCYGTAKPILFRMENPLVIDFDRDGKPDLLTSVYTTVKLEHDPEQPVIDCFSSYRIFGNGDTVLLGNEQIPQTKWKWRHVSDGGVYKISLRNGYATMAMLVQINILDEGQNCSFVLRYSASIFSTHPDGYRLSSANCKKAYPIQKYPGKFEYRTFNSDNRSILANTTQNYRLSPPHHSSDYALRHPQ